MNTSLLISRQIKSELPTFVTNIFFEKHVNYKWLPSIIAQNKVSYLSYKILFQDYPYSKSNDSNLCRKVWRYQDYFGIIRKWLDCQLRKLHHNDLKWYGCTKEHCRAQQWLWQLQELDKWKNLALTFSHIQWTASPSTKNQSRNLSKVHADSRHSITMWTMVGRGSKNVCFCPRSG